MRHRQRHSFAIILIGTLTAGCHGNKPDMPNPGVSPSCAASRQSCSKNGDCCSASCVAGQCACLGFASPCHSDADCCEEFACDNYGRCSFGCRADGTSCTSGGAACCSGSCKGGICGPPRCIMAGGGCDSSNDCCDSLGCVIGAGGRGTCQSGCATASQPCGGDGKSPFCCAGTRCGMNGGTCELACRPIGLSCTSTNECCDNLVCSGGKCRPCSGSGGTCASAGDCCGGTCQGGKCSLCQLKGNACAADDDCCARLHCRNGSCGCVASPGSCSSDDDCCDGLTCHQGHCGTLTCMDVGAQTANMSPLQSCNECCSGMCAADKTCCALDSWSCDATHECCGTDFCNASGACQACLSAGPGSCVADNQCCDGHCQGGVCCAGVYGSKVVPPPMGAPPIVCGNDYCCGGLECCNDGFPPALHAKDQHDLHERFGLLPGRAQRRHRRRLP
jgi:hypothetical protein